MEIIIILAFLALFIPSAIDWWSKKDEESRKDNMFKSWFEKLGDK